MKKISLFVLMITFLSLFYLPGIFIHNSSNNYVKNSTNMNIDDLSKINTNTATFSQLNVNNSNPTPNQAVNVTSVIYDPAGIKNASLYWTYNSINSTEFNSSMNLLTTTINSTGNFATTGYLFPNETATTTSTHYAYGNYSYELNDTSYISHFTTTISKANGNTLNYVQIQEKFIQDSFWTTVYEQGNINSTTTSLSSPIVFNDYNVSKGFRIYAVDYKGGGGGSASFPSLTLNAYQEFYSAVIPASHQPSLVTYYLKTFNNLNNVSQTTNLKLIMNTPLTIAVNSVPSVINDNLLSVNISVTDPDGRNWINQSSVMVYYSVSGGGILSSSLTLVSNKSLTTEAFAGTVNVTSLQATQNVTLTLYFGAKELILGYNPTAIVTSNYQAVLIGNPALTSNSQSSQNQQTSTGTETTNSRTNSGTNTGTSKNGNSSWSDIFTFISLAVLSIVGLKRKRKY